MGDEYMRLDLNEVGVWELCLLLLDEKIGARKFINSHDDEGLRGTFTHRFLIFISIVFIRGLKLISRPLECLGRFIESFLNLWTHYASFCMLVMNTIQGKSVELCRESPNFLSAIGLTDTRVELDDEIHREDPRYISALAIMAAKTAYENEARVKKIVEDHWKMEFVGFYNCSDAFDTKSATTKEHPTQAFIFIDKTGDHDLICVSFRGTSPFSADDWCTDLDFSWFLLHGIGKVHMGFMKALGLQKNVSWPKELEEYEEYDDKIFAYYKIRQVLREKLDENKNTRFIVTGHSLGGALAVLFPVILRFHKEFELLERLAGVYTFGQPRVGDGEFCKSMESLLGVERYFRLIYSNDIVPRIPFDDSDFMFKHFGYCYYFNSFYKGQVMKEVPNKNYFRPLYRPVLIELMYLNALFEVVRSGALTYAFGRKYKEGRLLLGVRLFGLILPGVSAHCPQDYVNLTRLCSPDTFNTFQEDYYSKQRQLLNGIEYDD
ncbi:triacylglycerol lipase OBL1-like [Bidens hawaiensis]|uniref:triacylglycerol lipase OBL1-like n=1 Tax=Bidens hawaiensis TaxID=980011 RepID=UPI004049107F